MDRRTRVVECPHCSDASAYVDVPARAVIVTDESTGRSTTAACLSCGHEFCVAYSTAG